MFAHMAIAALPPVRYLRMRVPRTAYPRLSDTAVDLEAALGMYHVHSAVPAGLRW